MSYKTKLLVTCIGLCLLSSSFAQEKKIYRWVDKNGKVQISDQLPPEELGKGHKEFSASTGTLQKEVQTRLSPAEQALADQNAKIEADANAAAENAKRIEQGMMANYETEQDLKRAFDERTDLLKNTLISLRASIQSRRAVIISTLNEIANLELNNNQAPAEKIQFINSNHRLILKQAAQFNRLSANYSTLQTEFAVVLEKYRAFKAKENGLVYEPSKPAATLNAKPVAQP